MSDTVPLLHAQDQDDEEEFLLVDVRQIQWRHSPIRILPSLSRLQTYPPIFPIWKAKSKNSSHFVVISHISRCMSCFCSYFHVRIDHEATLVFQTPDAARSAVLLTGTTLGDRYALIYKFLMCSKINVEAVPVAPALAQSSRIEALAPVEPEVKVTGN